ncbi:MULTISPECIES: phage tail tube protein [unclassified Rhizobium]|uniref:phage tail tube protein n=1 Tax=unclassified Rhizobium TaxID=2613769 RepID=UPI001AE1C65E|nr:MULTISPECIES: phage tail tube protein [unclassified Rhizobium]MBP2459587.1 putative secreted protein [Rhizobium sp. PvP014]MBP2531881.1 putative secreted protein [Rhizobium sp. PvP099]
MAPPVTARFGKFRVLLGNAASPIAYAAPCGFTSKSLSLGKSLAEVIIPDCDDPDKPSATGRDVESTTASIDGEGVLAASAVTTWLDAYESVDSIPVKVEVEFSSGIVTWTGYMHVETLEIGAEQGGRVTINVSLQSDGELVRTDTFA